MDLRDGTSLPTASVLALQGGGFMAFFGATILAEMDRFREKQGHAGPLRSKFDIIAGTSAGAIIAAGLAADIPPKKIVELMAGHGPEIFPRRWILPKWPGIIAARFSQAPLARLLEKLLGNLRLGDLQQPLLIPAFSLTKGRPVLYRSHDHALGRVRLADAVLASAAAPLFFPPHRHGGDTLADGGLIANGPAMLAAADLATLFDVPIGRQRIVSISATSKPWAPPPTRSRWGLRPWLAGDLRLLRTMLDGNVELQDQVLRAFGPRCVLSFDRAIAPEDAGKVNLVYADSEACGVLAAAAREAFAAVSPEERHELDLLLSRQAARLAFAPVPGGARPAKYYPVLQAATGAETPQPGSAIS